MRPDGKTIRLVTEMGDGVQSGLALISRRQVR